MCTRLVIVIILFQIFSSTQAQQNNQTRKSEDSTSQPFTRQSGLRYADASISSYSGKDSNIYDSVHVKAIFPGGNQALIQYIYKNFEYPPLCQEKGISGYVLLKFSIDLEGRIKNIKVIEETAACPEFAKEAIRVINQSPPWIPAQINGKFVNSWIALPIRLNIN